MNTTRRRLIMAALAIVAGILGGQRPAIAEPDRELCRAVHCSGGDRKCSEVSGTIVHEDCREEGIMCCPFPDEYFSLTCYEARWAT